MDATKTYEIGGKAYELVQPLYGVMERVVLFNLRTSRAAVDHEDLLNLLGGEAPAFVAELITPAGVHPRDRDVAVAVELLRWEKSSTLNGIVSDFFGQSDVNVKEIMATSEMLGRLEMMISGSRTGMRPPVKSGGKSACSPEATSSSATASDGESVAEG